jgi:hypothetical protein
MDHGPSPLKGAVKERRVENRPDDKLDAVDPLEILSPPSRQVINDDQAIDERLVAQGSAQVSTDEPGSTRDDYLHLQSPFERNLNAVRQGEAGLASTVELQSIDGRTVQSITRVEGITGDS